jgi:hypothetical protein
VSLIVAPPDAFSCGDDTSKSNVKLAPFRDEVSDLPVKFRILSKHLVYRGGLGWLIVTHRRPSGG